jgi:hypothetical protein
MYLKSVWWRGLYGRISGGTRALEVAMVSWEASPRKGARSLSTSHVLVEPFRGKRHDMTHEGGQWQAQERLKEAVAIFRISRRWKALYGGLFKEMI